MKNKKHTHDINHIHTYNKNSLQQTYLYIEYFLTSHVPKTKQLINNKTSLETYLIIPKSSFCKLNHTVGKIH